MLRNDIPSLISHFMCQRKLKASPDLRMWEIHSTSWWQNYKLRSKRAWIRERNWSYLHNHFILISIAWRVHQGLAKYPRSSRFSSRLSSRKFVVLHFACSFIIYFELNFVKGVTFVSISIFFFFYSCSSSIYWRNVFAPLYCFVLHWQISVTIFMSNSPLSFLFHWSSF